MTGEEGDVEWVLQGHEEGGGSGEEAWRVLLIGVGLEGAQKRSE